MGFVRFSRKRVLTTSRELGPLPIRNGSLSLKIFFLVIWAFYAISDAKGLSGTQGHLSAAMIQFYVATRGNDAWSGRLPIPK